MGLFGRNVRTIGKGKGKGNVRARSRQRLRPVLVLTIVLSIVMLLIENTIHIPKESKKHMERRDIPHIIHFVHTKMNILKDHKPYDTYQNIQNTIRLYKKAWDDTSGSSSVVHFWVDADCQVMIQKVYPLLLPFYRNETWAPFQADMCRIAALHLHGGYYSDVDMYTRIPLQFDHSTCQFSSCFTANRRYGFAQSFIASTPQNPILVESLKQMFACYTDTEMSQRIRTRYDFLGPYTLKKAYDLLNYSSIPGQDDCLLEEINLDAKGNTHLYPNEFRQQGSGEVCNYVMHNPRRSILHFFSRKMGLGVCK